MKANFLQIIDYGFEKKYNLITKDILYKDDSIVNIIFFESKLINSSTIEHSFPNREFISFTNEEVVKKNPSVNFFINNIYLGTDLTKEEISLKLNHYKGILISEIEDNLTEIEL